MNGKILFFDEWKNFNASLNEEIESRKLTEKQKEEFYKNGEFNKKYDAFLKEFLGTITGTIANYMSTYHIEKKQENDKNITIWNKYGEKDLIYIVFILIVYQNLEILY